MREVFRVSFLRKERKFFWMEPTQPDVPRFRIIEIGRVL